MTCAHHWLIEPPAGEMSLGRCRKCGEERAFRNAQKLDVGRWERVVQTHKLVMTRERVLGPDAIAEGYKE